MVIRNTSCNACNADLLYGGSGQQPSLVQVIILAEHSLMRLGEPGGLQRPEIVPPWSRCLSATEALPFPFARTLHIVFFSPPMIRRFTSTRGQEQNAILPKPQHMPRYRMPPWLHQRDKETSNSGYVVAHSFSAKRPVCLLVTLVRSFALLFIRLCLDKE